MQALKEWATVVKSLEDGEQTVLLRKGGILESDSGFIVESKKFFLFPTFEHQKLDHIKPEFHKYIEIVKNNHPAEGHNRISSYADVIMDVDVDSEEKVKALSSFHIWSDSYINERMNWMPQKPMKVMFLKVFKIPKLEVPLKSEYQGCKSWIDINEIIKAGEPVLSNNDIEKRLEKFKEIC